MKRPRATGIMERVGAGSYRWLLGAVMAIPLLAVPAGAQRPPTQNGVELPAKAMRQIETLLEAKEQRTPAQRKVISQLLDAARQLPEPTVSDRQLAADPDAIAESEWVTVDIRADVTPAVLARIRALGGTVVNSVPKYRTIRDRLPLAALEPLATIEAVQFIRPADEPIMQRVFERSAVARAVAATSKVNTSEGDVAHQANVARQTYGVDGTGIGIGVISDGVDTLADQQATGDVPAQVLVLPGQEGGSFDLACGGRSSGTEGTAMLEIVHDLAPGADLFFADGGGGRAQMAQNIQDLCAAGADIIVDDIGYLGASAFQDDVIAEAISAAAANGCFYFSSTGNSGNLNDGTAGVWEGDFVSGGTLSLNGISSGAVVHDFGGGVTGNRIKTNSTRPIILQWADPVDGSANDYDLFLIDEDDNVLASSTSTQDGTQDPIEYIGRSCSNDREDTRLVIVKNSGAEDRYVRLNYGRGTLELATAGQTFGHSASQDAIGVAAVDVGDAGGAGGVFDGTESVETFSSDGPRRIFFESDGTPITPGNFSSTGGRVLQKPDLAAADAVSTSTPGFSTFKGTSAAAPHAAAIAALMLEAAGGPDNVMPADLRTAMTGAALDIEETGVDQDSGAGIVMAPGAVDAVDVAVADRNGAPTVTGTLDSRTLIRGADAVTVNVASVFSDPDNDTLTYNALSSDPDRLEISLTGSMLTLTPRVPGRVVVAVRATDSSGLSVTAAVSVTVAVGTRDYDVDDDGLIAVATLAQLDAIRYDLNGDGMVDVASDWRSYYADTAFAEGAIDMGCPSGCMGYELADDLDFDTNGNGVADAGDDYWNGGDGWAPIGGTGSTSVGTTLRLRNPFSAIFEGNGHTVSNLFMDTDTIVLTGFFGYSVTRIRNLGLIDVDVKGTGLTAGLAAFNSGEIRASYVTGRVSADDNVGGLAGFNQTTGRIRGSYATSNVSGSDDVGGLVGDNRGEIAASYATGPVSGDSDVGGLVGNNKSTGEIRAGYATGPASGNSDIGGLVGRDEGGTIASSYWDTRTSGHLTGDYGTGRTTSALQSPRGYSGIYSTWNVDVDGDGMANQPWDFGTSGQYPALKVNFDAQGTATWQEFGYQLRDGPTLTATSPDERTEVALTWTPVDRSVWTPPPDVTYTVTRDDGTTVETLGEGLDGFTYTDVDVTAGDSYFYQVAAVVAGGEPVRSARVDVKVTPPMLSAVTLDLSSSSIGENGGVSTVTARLDRASAADTTVLVSAMAVDPAISNDFMLSANRILTITAGQTGSTGTVTITANNNDVDAPNKTVTVLAAAGNTYGVTGPSAVTLTINDDDAAPAVTLWLTPGSIGENRGVSTVSASLDRASSAVTTVTVSAMAVNPAVSDDFMLSTNKTLTIAAGRTDSAGTVTVRAVDNNVDATNKEVRVSAAADNSHGVAGNPSPVTLRITDDDDAPQLALAVRPSAIAEDGGVSTVAVESVNGVAFAQDQRIALAFAGTAAKGTDYTVALERLTLTAGQSSVDTTVTTVDDAIDDDAETILVTARHGGGVLGAERTITIADDDDAPVIQTASPILVEENETAVATLAATDADRPPEDLRWRITGGADRNRFRLTADGVLTFAAAEDYEAPGDSDRDGDYEVTAEVSDGFNPVEAVFTVRLQDVDDTPPMLSSASVNGATLTLTYGEAPYGNSRPAAGDFTVSGGNSARTVSNVAVSGRAVTLTLNPAVEHGETGIRVSYRPGANPIRDAAGNDALGLSNEPVTNNTGDTTAPTVSRVEITSRLERNATYAAGKEIAVTVTFSETVVVTGTPLLRLNVGGVNRTANYRGGTGATLRFAYAVADGESDAVGVSIEANRLTGTIRDGANNNAVLTHDGLAADERHKVDGVKPALLAGGATVNGATLTLTYDEALDGSSTPVALAFTVNVEGAEPRVSRVAVSGNAVTLTLEPEVSVGQTVRLDYRAPGANPIQGAVGNYARPLTNTTVENNTLDTTAPRVSRVAIASNPGPDGIYAEGDVMEVTVTFSETVQVDTTNGTPALALRVGRQTRPATYDRGSNSDRPAFSYMVTDGDLDTDGVSIAAGRIALNGGTIQDLADNPAVLAYEAVPPQPGHAVDGVRPELQGAAVRGATLTLTYNEALDEDSTPGVGDFTVNVADVERPLTEVLVSGSAVELTLDSPVTPGQTVTVSYTPGTRPIQDAAGNAAEDLTEYTVGTPPPIIITPPRPPRPPTTGGGGGGGGRARPPSYPGTIRAEGGDGEVTLTWNAPASQGSSRIQHYEYRVDGEGEWISTGSTDRTHTIAGLIAGRVYFFHLRAVSAAGPGAHRISPEATPVADLDFTHFANGGFITSTLALVNAGAYPVRPAIYFYDRDGDPIAARRVVDLTPDLEVGDDGALRPRTVMNPLEELTIATHGRGGLRAGSVTVRAASSIGGFLRFDIPNLGVAGVGDSATVRDALVPVRRQHGGINTGVAVRNRGTAALTVRCQLMRDGAVLEEADIRLRANGQDSRFINEVFPTADTSDFAGSVRCAAPEPGRFSAVAFELDGVNRIFTTLPVVPVPAPAVQEQEQEQDATRLDFTHFANGGKIVSSLVLVNAGADPVRPAIYFHNQGGNPIATESMVDITDDLEVGDDGTLRPGAAINPLGELTISTHGRGVLKVGSVAVTADGPIGGVLRFDIPGLGVAGVGDSPPVRDALVPVRRQRDGINTGVAVHNRGATALLVRCRLMRDGAVLEETMIPLAANGQDSRFIHELFPTADTSDFAGSVRCLTPEPGRFSAVAFELDGVNRIFTTLPVVPVVDVE